MEKRKVSVGFIIGLVIVSVLMLAVIELNKSRLIGFIAVPILAVAFAVWHEMKLKNRRASVKALGWVAFVLAFFVLVAISWPATKAVPAVDVPNPERTEIIHLAQGDVRGVFNEDKTVEVYTGIPYAKPPVGELRFREPEAAGPWEGVLEADTFAPMSMQPTRLPIYNSLAQIIGYHDYKITMKDNFMPPVSEDSLYLNIWKPAGDVKDLPVIVYIHGGTLQTGQPWYADYSGMGLAKEGVIVVNLAYRLGIFGYYADEELMAESPNHTTGNYGLLDQILALKWVNDNIEAFGGNPENITLSGESAGSAAVSAVCASPLAKGLFERAVLESSTVVPVMPTHSFRLMDEALESGRDLKARHGCQTVADLRKLSAKELVSEAETQHHMTVDGYALVKTPFEIYLAGEYNEKAILHGYNHLEAAAFILFDGANLKNYEDKMRGYFGDYYDEAAALYPAKTDDEAAANWEEIWGAVFFDYPHYCLNRLAVKNGIPVYEYYFTKENGRIGSWHSGEEVYLYGNIPEDSDLYDDYDRKLSDAMKSYFINFATTGDPNGEGLPTWEQNLTSNNVLEFGDNFGMINEEEHELFALLDKMQGFTLD
ncbi:MAG: carboxylesterase family protein [Lachnospiraceae bacterium]|nr:carboxylesterase family protein [Lachnospiraceae bacterium]